MQSRKTPFKPLTKLTAHLMTVFCGKKTATDEDRNRPGPSTTSESLKQIRWNEQSRVILLTGHTYTVVGNSKMSGRRFALRVTIPHPVPFSHEDTERKENFKDTPNYYVT